VTLNTLTPKIDAFIILPECISAQHHAEGVHEKLDIRAGCMDMLTDNFKT